MGFGDIKPRQDRAGGRPDDVWPGLQMPGLAC